MEAVAMKLILSGLSQSIDQRDVALRVGTQLLETVYIAVEDDAVIVHDRGETFFCIRSGERTGGDDTYTPWSRGAAQAVLDRYRVDIVGYEDEHSSQYRLQIALTASDDVSSAVGRLSSAIDGVFAAHYRADLR